MKKLILALSITLLASQAFGADFRYNVPLPRPAPEKVALSTYANDPITISQTNPDPFNTQRRAQAPVQQAEQQPVVIQNQQARAPGLLEWIWTGLGTVATGLFGFNALRKGGSAPAPSAPGGEVRDVARQVLLDLFEKDIPGAVVRTAASTVPVASPILALIQPMIHNMILEQLRGAGVAPAPATAAQATPDQRIEKLESIVADLAVLVRDRLKSGGAAS